MQSRLVFVFVLLSVLFPCQNGIKFELDVVTINGIDTVLLINADDLNPRNYIIPSTSLVGPILVIDADDEDAEVKVRNRLSNGSPTTLHFHGLYQDGTPFYDGVPNVTQPSIQVNTSFTYRLRPQPRGTHYFHSHFNLQSSHGIKGGFVVKDSSNPYMDQYDVDSIVWMLSDYQEEKMETSYKRLSSQMEMNSDDSDSQSYVTSDLPWETVLLNGHCTYISSKCEPFEVSVSHNDRHRIRLVNSGSNFVLSLHIEHHYFRVIASDGEYIQAVNTESIVIGVGERVDFILIPKNTLKQSQFKIFINDYNNITNIHHAVLKYRELPSIYQNTAIVESEFNPSFSPEKYSHVDTNSNSMPRAAADFNVTFVLSGSMNPYQWKINDRIFQYPSSILTDVNNWQKEFDNLSILQLPLNAVIDIRIVNSNNMCHPMHLHGFHFWVVSAGKHNAPGASSDNPIFKDTVLVPANSWMQLRVSLTHAGPYMFHCHTVTHIAAGMAAVLLVGTAAQQPRLPSNFYALEGKENESRSSFSQQWLLVVVAVALALACVGRVVCRQKKTYKLSKMSVIRDIFEHPRGFGKDIKYYETVSDEELNEIVRRSDEDIQLMHS